MELKCQLDLVLFVWFRWFWGLTCDFWAENGGRKIAGMEGKLIQRFAGGFLVDSRRIGDPLEDHRTGFQLFSLSDIRSWGFAPFWYGARFWRFTGGSLGVSRG
jgi:hypothetical protein